jgi:D-sedoheptulose 7-phosphate isomerase
LKTCRNPFHQILYFCSIFAHSNPVNLSSHRVQSLIQDAVQQSIAVKEELLRTCAPAIQETGQMLVSSLEQGGKILFCGNGGSAADSQHIAAELVIRFRGNVNRRALPAMALSTDPSMMTAGGNDIGFENVFARLVEAFGGANDVVVGISTSGNSPNVLRAFEQAQRQGLRTVGLLGGSGGSICALSDASVIVPSTVTARIQESHILIGHIWCEMIEEALFPELFS